MLFAAYSFFCSCHTPLPAALSFYHVHSRIGVTHVIVFELEQTVKLYVLYVSVLRFYYVT